MKKKTLSLFDTLRERIRIETDNTIFLCKTSNWLIESQGTREVINRIDNPPEKVKAANWFGNIWLYLKIKLQEDKERNIKDIPFVSICFFQEVNSELNMLFRAEWDNYPLNAGYNHPQPHWHITNMEVGNDSFEELEELKTEEIMAGDYAELFNDTQKSLDIYKMHFSMSGDWALTGKMTTGYIDNEQIASWISNLLRHVKEEIKYALH